MEGEREKEEGNAFVIKITITFLSLKNVDIIWW